MNSIIFSSSIGAIIGIIIGSIILLLKSNKPLSQKDIKRFEKKHKRSITEEDMKAEQARFKKNGIIDLIIGLVALTIILIMLYTHPGALSYMIYN